MRWQGRRESDNVEDRRQSSGGNGGGLGGGFPIFSLLGGKGKIIAIIVVIVAGYYGIDLSPLITGSSTQQVSSVPYHSNNSNNATLSATDQQAAKFTSVILATTEDTWTQLFKQLGKQYTAPKLVMYRNATQTACGAGQTMMGPFYCPTDSTVYIDLAFYDEMKRRLGGGGDFAQGYVIAHEVGHHVQHLLGIESQVRQLQQRGSQTQANQLSVKLELQADCFAGIWGNAMQKQNILDPGDLQQALNTAQSIGDDTLQKESQGRVMPDSFTHGSSEQRYTWFKRGFDSGDVNSCNTFASQ